MRNTLNRAFLLGLVSFLPTAGTNLLAQAIDLKSGLKAYWNFDAKNFKDTAGIFDGTESGSAPIAFTASKAGLGQALQLDGVDQRVEITGGEPDDLAFQGGSMTVAGWFKVGAFDKSWQALVAKGEGSSWRIHRRGGEPGFAHAGGTGEGPAMAEGVDDGNWHHFAAISDVDAVNFGTALYIDGVQATSFAGAPNLAANGKRMMIGDNPDANGRFWNGLVDDIAIWDRPLNEKEVGALYNKGAGASLSSLLGSGPADTDKDGMPDDWETANGLNPNDASDAAKDLNVNGISNLDEFKGGFDPRDTVKPTIVSVSTTGTFDKVTITLSKALDPATATNVANYAITPALAISSISLKGSVVTLTVAKQTPGATGYTVTLNGVKSVNQLAIAANSKTIFYSYLLSKDGVLKFSYWGAINGTPVDNLYQDPRYPAAPDLVAAVSSFSSRDAFPDDSHENYGATMEGYLTPTETGSYRFFVHSDDASQFFLSSDDKEANLAQVAEEAGCCNNFTEPDSARTSEPVALTAGKKYFVRLVYKEGGGGDYGRIAWRKEGDKTAAGALPVIPGKFLSAAVDLPVPSEGSFKTQSPAPGAKSVSPNTAVTIAHADGKTPWTAANVTLKFDGKLITPTPLIKDGALATISYQPQGLLPSKTKHVITVAYKDAGNKDQVLEWTFEVAAYGGPVLDVVKGYAGLVRGSATITADKGGASGKAGDRAMDMTAKGGPVQVIDSAFLKALNTATASDEMSVSLWINKYDIKDSSAVWVSSPTQGRVFQAHTPWSNNHIYFDTAGCCDGTTQRIEAGIDTFPGYTDESWWKTWRLYVFNKKGDAKQIYIDGQLFLEGSSSGLLSTDIDQFMIGSDNGGGALLHGLVDDMAVYSKALTTANINSLKGGTKPTALPAAAGLIANWDFNTPIGDTTSLTQGLVAYWNFDGTLMDSVKDFHGTGRGATPVAFGEDHANFGKALQLNGKDQYVEITGGNEDELEFPNGSMTIAGWFKVGAFDKSWQALLSKGEGSNYRIARRGDGNAVGYAGGVGEGADDVGSVNDGQWHHFVAVSDATGAAFGTALYIDGVLHGINATKPVLTATTKRLFIGENPDSLGRQWNGSIDDLAIWKRVLTGGEVATLWNSGAGLPLSTLPSIKPPSEPLKVAISTAGGNATISWAPSGGTLESSPTLGAGAVWTAVGTANPATITVGNANVFYRVRK